MTADTLKKRDRAQIRLFLDRLQPLPFDWANKLWQAYEAALVRPGGVPQPETTAEEVMSNELSDLHLRDTATDDSRRSVSGASVEAGAQHPAENTANTQNSTPLFRRHAEDLPPRMLVYKASEVDAILQSARPGGVPQPETPLLKGLIDQLGVALDEWDRKDGNAAPVIFREDVVWSLVRAIVRENRAARPGGVETPPALKRLQNERFDWVPWELVEEIFSASRGAVEPPAQEPRDGGPSPYPGMTWGELLRHTQMERDRLADQLEALRSARSTPPPERPQADDETRCAVCGWTLAKSVASGCVRGNCSLRPLPVKAYSPERADREYGIVRWTRASAPHGAARLETQNEK